MPFFGGGGAGVDLASPSAIGSTTPNTGAFTTLSFAPANNTTGFSNTGNSLTGSNAQSLISLAQTWNTTGSPTAIKLNITDTASGSASYLMDLQVGGSSRATINRSGGIQANIGQALAGLGFTFLGGTNGIYSPSASGSWYLASSGNAIAEVRSSGLGLGSHSLSWGSIGSTQDVILTRDAAAILAQRNATNAQAFRLYNTFTSSTNFERLNFRWASNEFILDAEKGSAGGTLRGIKIGSAITSLLGFYGVTPVDQPATVTDPTGGGTQDAEARTAINVIIDRLQELGLIA